MNSVKKTRRKCLLSIFATLCMVFTLLPITAFSANPVEAKIGDAEFKYLRSAVLEMLRDPALWDTVYLQNDVGEGRGIDVIEDINAGYYAPTIDFNEHTYIVTYNLAGATNYKSQCLRVWPSSTNGRPTAGVTIKNGTLTNGAPSSGEKNYVRMLIQNWGSLTIEDMVLDGRNLYEVPNGINVVISNNEGPVTIKGSKTQIIAKDGQYAFDVCNSLATGTADVTVEDGVTVQGRIQYDCGNYTGTDLKLTLKINGGTFLNDASGNGGIEVINSAGEEKIEISGGTFSYAYEDALNKYIAPGKGYYDMKPIDGSEMFRIGDLCPVKFEMNAHGTSPGDRDVPEGSLVEEPAAPAEQGWTFAGWYSDPTFNNAWTFAADRVTGPTTLYAKWQQNTTYKVSIDPATGGTVTADKTEAEAGEKVRLTVVKSTGYELDRLTVTWGGTDLLLEADNSFTMPRGEVVVKAAFKKIIPAGGNQQTPGESGKTNSPAKTTVGKAASAKTGDGSNMILWIFLLAASIWVTAAFFTAQKRTRNNTGI